MLESVFSRKREQLAKNVVVNGKSVNIFGRNDIIFELMTLQRSSECFARKIKNLSWKSDIFLEWNRKFLLLDLRPSQTSNQIDAVDSTCHLDLYEELTLIIFVYWRKQEIKSTNHLVLGRFYPSVQFLIGRTNSTTEVIPGKTTCSSTSQLIPIQFVLSWISFPIQFVLERTDFPVVSIHHQKCFGPNNNTLHR